MYVYVGSHHQLVDFLHSLRELGTLDKGEYVIVSLDDYFYDPKGSKSQYIIRGKTFSQNLFVFITIFALFSESLSHKS